MVLLCADDPWHTGDYRIGEDTVTSDLKASPEVIAAVSVLRAEIDHIWEEAWRFTWNAVNDGVNEEFHITLNSNPVLASLFFEMQHTVGVWREAGMSVDQIPPHYFSQAHKAGESLFGSGGTVMGYVKVISLRRWNWLPWFKRTYYVPTCESVDVGGRLPLFSRYEDALKFLSIMERVR